MFKLSGFDDCLIGLVSGGNAESRLCYSVEAVVEKMAREHGSTQAEAYEVLIESLLHAPLDDEGPVFLEFSTMEEIASHGTALEQMLDKLSAGEH